MNRLDAIKSALRECLEMAGKATPGEWQVDQAGHGSERMWLIDSVLRDQYGNNSIGSSDEATIRHIAKSRTLAPAAAKALLCAIEALEAIAHTRFTGWDGDAGVVTRAQDALDQIAQEWP